MLPAALCGLTRYRSGTFGESYRDRLFSTHYMLHKVVRHDLIGDGSSFRAEDTDFLSTTAHDVRLTDVLEDADGSLLVVDMGAWFTYGFPGNPLPSPRCSGRFTGFAARGQAGRRPLGQAAEARAADRRGTRRVARRPPAEGPRSGDRPSGQAWRPGGERPRCGVASGGYASPRREREAAWALCRIGTPEALRTLRQALTDEDEGVRLAAAHAAGLWRDGAAVSDLARLVEGDTPSVRRKAAEALGRIGDPEAVPALLGGLRKGGDRFLEHSLIYAILRIDDRKATLPALADVDPKVRRAGLIALDQMKDGRLSREQVAPLLQADDPALKLAALEVVTRRPEWPDLTEQVVGTGSEAGPGGGPGEGADRRPARPRRPGADPAGPGRGGIELEDAGREAQSSCSA